jgi:uncharacterized cupin superfamily protein
VVPEAQSEQTDAGVVVKSEGWFVVNAKEARWYHGDTFGSVCDFEGQTDFRDLGINIHVLNTGQPSCMYHGENAQEDFLVLAGECLLLVAGDERPLKQWDFVHCPPWTEHVFVGAGSGPCVILMVGVRPEQEELLYPVADVALRHSAGVEQETTSGDEAYARFPRSTLGPYREGTLPGLGG